MTFRTSNLTIILKPALIRKVVLYRELMIYFYYKIGLCSINNEPENNIILTYPDKVPGKVSLCFYKESSSKDNTSKENISKENTITINAHNSVLSCIELDNRGLKLATSSEKVYLSLQKTIHSFLGNCYKNF